MNVTKIPGGRRYTTENGPVIEAVLVEQVGSMRTHKLTVDGVVVGFLHRPGSSPQFRTSMVHAPAEYQHGRYIGTFDRAAYEVATAGASWLNAKERNA